MHQEHDTVSLVCLAVLVAGIDIQQQGWCQLQHSLLKGEGQVDIVKCVMEVCDKKHLSVFRVCIFLISWVIC